MEHLLLFLNSIYPLSQGLQEHLKCILKHRIIDKKQHLLENGKICNSIYFIEEGLFKCYHINDNGKEVCSWFMMDGDVIVSVESFYKQIASNENIQALEKGSVYSISYSQLQNIYITYPEFNYIGRVLTEKYYCQSEQRLFWLRMNKASEKYRLLRDNYPELVQKVSSKHIASFLGISMETLSRIKASKIINIK